MIPRMLLTPGLRGRLLVVGGVLLLVLALLQVRIAMQPIQPYGDSGAAYIEHAIRVELVEQIRTGEHHGAWDLLVRADGESHPPMLHLAHAAAGVAVGHDAATQARLAPLWLVLLAGALALVGRALGGGRAAAAAWVGALLLPAAHGAATRVHYDLPMTALLWAAVAVLLTALGTGRGRWAAALIAGLALFAAALTKWTAVPYGAAMLLGVALTPVGSVRARLATVGGAAVLAGAGIAAYLAETTESFSGGTLAIGEAGIGSLGWYAVHGVLAVLSPIGAILLAGLAWRWWRSGRTGVGLVGAVVLGHLAFLVVMVSVLDERFLLTLAPALVLAASLGWSALPGGARQRSGVAISALLSGVAVDMHVGPGWLTGDSVERRGWARAATTPDDEPARRAAAWRLVQDCGVQRLGVPGGIADSGDVWWLRYRSALARLNGWDGHVLVLNHTLIAGRDLWWPDPDTNPDVWEYDALGFSWDDLPDPPPSTQEALSASGIPPSVFGAFPPDGLLVRLPLDPEVALPPLFRTAGGARRALGDDVDVALLTWDGACPVPRAVRR